MPHICDVIHHLIELLIPIEPPGHWPMKKKLLVPTASFYFVIPVGADAITCGEQLDKVHKKISIFL